MCSVLCSQVYYYLGGGGNVYIVPRGMQITHFCLAHIMDSGKKILYISFSCQVTSQVVLVDEKGHFSMPMIMKKGKSFIMFMF